MQVRKCLESGCNVQIPVDRYLCPEHLSGPTRGPQKKAPTLSVSMSGQRADSLAEVLDFFDQGAWRSTRAVMRVVYLASPIASSPPLFVIRREGLGTCLWVKPNDIWTRPDELGWISKSSVHREGKVEAYVDSTRL